MRTNHNNRFLVAFVVEADHVASVLGFARLEFEEGEKVIDHLASRVYVRNPLFAMAVYVVYFWDESLSHVLFLLLCMLWSENFRILIFKSDVI